MSQPFFRVVKHVVEALGVAFDHVNYQGRGLSLCMLKTQKKKINNDIDLLKLILCIIALQLDRTLLLKT